MLNLRLASPLLSYSNHTQRAFHYHIRRSIRTTKTMALLPSTLIAYTVATLYILAGQAHFTASITPSLAATVEQMTPNAHAVFGAPLGLSYQTVRPLAALHDSP